MFISNGDKQYLLDQVKALVKDMSIASTEITFLRGKVKALEGGLLVLKEEARQAKITPKKPKTAAQKAKQREYMRKYTARKRAEKLALEQK